MPRPSRQVAGHAQLRRLALSGTSIRRKRHESVMSSVMGSGPNLRAGDVIPGSHIHSGLQSNCQLTPLVVSPDRFVSQKCSDTPCGCQAPPPQIQTGLTTRVLD